MDMEPDTRNGLDEVVTGYTVCLMDLFTGQTRRVHHDLTWHGSSEFWWADGNMGCDCNRATYFYDYDDTVDIPCGNDRYDLLWIELDTGQRIYPESMFVD